MVRLPPRRRKTQRRKNEEERARPRLGVLSLRPQCTYTQEAPRSQRFHQEYKESKRACIPCALMIP